MSKPYSFTIGERTITLEYKIKGHSGRYYIPIQSLGNIRGGESDWIIQLLDKIWIGKETLYELAKIIKQFQPDNKINWFSTFSMVESNFLLDEKNSKTDQSELLGSIRDKTSDDLGRARTPEFEQEVQKRVNKNMSAYGIQ